MKAKKIVLVPYPAQGHVTPMVHLARALQKTHGFESIIVNPDFIHQRITEFQAKQHGDDDHEGGGGGDGVTFFSIPDGLNVNEPHDFFNISFAMENNMPVHLEHLIGSLDGVVCVVVDFLASWAIPVANRCNVPVAGFWPAMLASYNLITAIPDMIQLGLISESGIPRHQGTTLVYPAQPRLRVEDLPWLIGNMSAQKSRFRFWIQALSRSRSLKWILVNSFLEECVDDCCPKQYSSIQCHNSDPQVFQVGPLGKNTLGATKNPSFWEEDQSCIDWLDNQKIDSVIYVSFGSWVDPINENMITELALGLEATRRPFIWVLAPTWRKGLPNGYLERVGGLGKVLSWAPQKEVLQHEAVGCCITHCGWNSTMEAIECGKKLLCYPVAGDQFVNSAYIVKVWGIGVKLDGLGRDDVEQGVNRIMEEGGDIEQRVMELKERITSEESTSRANATLAAFIDDLKKSNTNSHVDTLDL